MTPVQEPPPCPVCFRLAGFWFIPPRDLLCVWCGYVLTATEKKGMRHAS